MRTMMLSGRHDTPKGHFQLITREVEPGALPQVLKQGWVTCMVRARAAERGGEERAEGKAVL